MRDERLNERSTATTGRAGAAIGTDDPRSISPELVLVTPELRRELLAEADDVHGSSDARTNERPLGTAPAARPNGAHLSARLRPVRLRRIVKAVMLSACFFAGCALAAGAGDEAAKLLDRETRAGEERTSLSPRPEERRHGRAKPAVEAGGFRDHSEQRPVRHVGGPPRDDARRHGKPAHANEPSKKGEDSTSVDDSPPGAEISAKGPPPESAPPGAEGDDATNVGAPAAIAPEAKAEDATLRGERSASGAKNRRAATRRARGERSARAQDAKTIPPIRLAPEVTLPGAQLAPLPDPTPRARRLPPRVARVVRIAARRAGVDWALLLAALRTRSPHSYPAYERVRIRAVARTLSRGARPARALARAVGASRLERAATLASYNRAVGLEALVSGLRAAKPILAARVATDPRIVVYAGGREDVARGRVDVRVLALTLYLAEHHEQVTVSSLISGHRTYSRPGVVSAHVPGRAVDVSALGGVPVAGHQRRGSVVERAVRGILLLPEELQAQQVISLFDLGGASFALRDHDDHIHIGYGATPSRGWEWLRTLWRRAGARYGVPWRILGAINKIESDYGRNMGPSSAGAVGWMQFMPATWARWGTDADRDGVADPRDPDDAVFSAARYLEASGARTNLEGSLYAYNHANWYVRDVVATAARIP